MSQLEAGETHSLAAWLDMLAAVTPPRGILLVGAGAGNGEFVQWLQRHDEKAVCLVEGDSRQHSHLVSTVQSRTSWTVRRDVVAGDATAVTFYHASNSAESGLIQPESLQTLWPNLVTERATDDEHASTLDTLAGQSGIQINWLVLDCLPGGVLLKGGAVLLRGIDVLVARVITADRDRVPECATCTYVQRALASHGLRLAKCMDERHPGMGLAIFVRGAQGPRDLSSKMRDGLNVEGEVCKVKTNASVDASVSDEPLARRGAQLEGSVPPDNSKLERLGERIEVTIQREIANAVKQIEAFANLQGYMASGELMPLLHNWPVSPDFALVMVELLEQCKFDVVVEFGSGSSTLLIARSLALIAKKRPHERRPVQIAFEHLEKYHVATADLLICAGLRDEVLLELSPLVPTVVASGETLNYYDPGDVLIRAVKALGEIDVPRILAVVDGPPESIGPLARYPALEMLLGAFPQQQGFLLLDDYRRQGEQEVARRWQELLQARGIEHEVTEYPLEKSACLIRFDSGRSPE